MAFTDRVSFGRSANIYGNSLVPDWLSAEHSTGVSNLTLYPKFWKL